MKMKKLMKLSKFKACICEGAAERAILDILLENDLLIFSKKELIDDDIIRCRDAKEFESRYLRKIFEHKISVIRILDREKEKFNISKPYKDKIDVVNIVTSPEIEMLIICSENKYDEYCKVKSKMSPSDYCKQNLPKLKYDKKYETVKTYFNTPEKLVNAIKLYHKKHQSKGLYTLSDLLK
jgi:hypothetical protein